MAERNATDQSDERGTRSKLYRWTFWAGFRPLALFKRNAGEDLAGSRGVLPTFYRLLPRSVSRERDIETYFLVANTYAHHDRAGKSAISPIA